LADRSHLIIRVLPLPETEIPPRHFEDLDRIVQEISDPMRWVKHQEE